MKQSGCFFFEIRHIEIISIRSHVYRLIPRHHSEMGGGNETNVVE